MTPKSLKNGVDSIKSELGRSNAFSDGVIVVADRVEALERLNQALDQLEMVPANSWVAQFYLVTLNNKAKVALGITSDYEAKFTASISSAAPSAKLASFSLNALLQSTYENSGSRLVAPRSWSCATAPIRSCAMGSRSV